jgi:hypothetical protein
VEEVATFRPLLDGFGATERRRNGIALKKKTFFLFRFSWRGMADPQEEQSKMTGEREVQTTEHIDYSILVFFREISSFQ